MPDPEQIQEQMPPESENHPANYPKNQLLPGLSFEEYEQIGGVRAGNLQKMRITPAHFRHGEQTEDTDALRLGRYIHSALERGNEFLSILKVMPEFKGKTKDGKESDRCAESKAMKAEWLSKIGPNEYPVKKTEYDVIAGILKSVTSHGLLKRMLHGASPESSLIVDDPETGLTLQCRIDALVPAGYLVDYKSTRHAHWDYFQYSVFSRRVQNPFYILSAAHYVHCARVAGLLKKDSFTYIAIEKKPPYGIQIFPMNTAQLEVGEQVRKRLTLQYAECEATGIWPGYPEQAIPTSIPTFVDYEGADCEA